MFNDELVIVDAGHGGLDSGAVANNMEEKDLNLQSATYIYNRLQELGIPAVLVREDDEYLPKSARVKRINNIVNRYPNSILISNHINAGGGEGAEVVYSLRNNSDFAELILDNIGDKGQIKRKVYQRRLPENPNKDYYYIMRDTNAKEPVLIEYGFIDNKNDAVKLRNNLEDYAEAVVESIAEYLGYPYEEIEVDEYTVKKGDTLYSISRRFNIPVNEIMRLNNLTSNILTVGQKLRLSESTQLPSQVYIVKKGDTLWSISRQFNVPIEDIIELNNLKSNTLTIGQELYITRQNPDIEDNNTPPTPDEPENDDYQIYVVQKGDSLWLISRKFNITVPQLIELNNLEDLTLHIGQRLLVPNINIPGNDNNDNNDDNNNSNDNNNNPPQPEEKYYTVQSGDTLWSIAKNNNISVDELKAKNNLTSNLLSVGQQLII